MRIALLFVLAFALAGCSDSGGSTDAPIASSSSTTTTGPPPKPVVTSDTLHLLAPPQMALALPSGSSEVSTPATTGFNGPGGGGGGQDDPGAAWSYVVTAPSNVSGAQVNIWIEITETLVPSPFTNPTQPACTWILVLELGADGEPEFGCLAEPTGPINPGVKELVFTFAGLGTEMEVNETIHVEFRRTAFSASANNSVFVLSGSTDHDSRVKLNGFKDPIPDA